MNISDVKFYLRDRNSELADAWARYFKGIEQVQVSCGDIFDLAADAVASPANSFGFMAYRTGSGSDRVVVGICAPSMHQTRSLPLPVLYSSSRRRL